MLINESRAEERELLRQCVVPVILGNGITAHLLSLRLFLKYRTPSLLCGHRRGLADFLNPCCDFFHLHRQRDGRLASEQLADLADAYSDCLFVLILLSEKDRTLLCQDGSPLESRYLVRSPKQLFDLPPFGSL